MSWARTAGGRRFGWERWPLAAIVALVVSARWFYLGAWPIALMFLGGAIVFALVAVRRR